MFGRIFNKCNLYLLFTFSYSEAHYLYTIKYNALKVVSAENITIYQFLLTTYFYVLSKFNAGLLNTKSCQEHFVH